jgi:hypothetical protein
MNAPEWRSLSLAVQHVAKFKDTEAAAKIELERALAQGLKTRASRLSAGLGTVASDLPGLDPRDGLPTSIWRTQAVFTPVLCSPPQSDGRKTR